MVQEGIGGDEALGYLKRNGVYFVEVAKLRAHVDGIVIRADVANPRLGNGDLCNQDSAFMSSTSILLCMVLQAKQRCDEESQKIHCCWA